MIGPRASLWLAGAALTLLYSTPGAAQANDGNLLTSMRACARIDEATARLACYDGAMRASDAPSQASAPQAIEPPRNGAAPSSPPSPPVARGGFGSEDIRAPQRSESRPAEQASLSSVVTGVSPREPGVYLLTLRDGAQWQFAESVNRSYRVPHRGDAVTIERAALGSFLLRYNNQAGVRVRRVR